MIVFCVDGSVSEDRSGGRSGGASFQSGVSHADDESVNLCSEGIGDLAGLFAGGVSLNCVSKVMLIIIVKIVLTSTVLIRVRGARARRKIA